MSPKEKVRANIYKALLEEEKRRNKAPIGNSGWTGQTEIGKTESPSENPDAGSKSPGR